MLLLVVLWLLLFVVYSRLLASCVVCGVWCVVFVGCYLISCLVLCVYCCGLRVDGCSLFDVF